MDEDRVIGAFADAHAARLTGVSLSQLRAWDREAFFRPSYAREGRRVFARIYSFRDLVELRALALLRNQHRVPMPELRRTAAELERLGEDWASKILYVRDRTVVLNEPETGLLRQAT